MIGCKCHNQIDFQGKEHTRWLTCSSTDDHRSLLRDSSLAKYNVTSKFLPPNNCNPVLADCTATLIEYLTSSMTEWLISWEMTAKKRKMRNLRNWDLEIENEISISFRNESAEEYFSWWIGRISSSTSSSFLSMTHSLNVFVKQMFFATRSLTEPASLIKPKLCKKATLSRATLKLLNFIAQLTISCIFRRISFSLSWFSTIEQILSNYERRLNNVTIMRRAPWNNYLSPIYFSISLRRIIYWTSSHFKCVTQKTRTRILS